MSTFVVPRRFNGPPSSGNGGYVAGSLAELSGLGDDVTVQLRKPPPLEKALDVTPVEGRVELRDGDDVVAVAIPDAPESWTDTLPVTVAQARSVEESYVGHRHHPFPTCFSCGPQRDDGLRIFPGRVDDRRVAASWTPAPDLPEHDGRIGVPVTWAALDCVGGWSSDLEHRPMVLASMAARVGSPPQAGASYVVVGTQVRSEGRKTWTASAMFDTDGHVIAQAEQLWIVVDWAVVQHLQGG
ncbi:MAG TPA: hypothetical protein VFG72_08205 [Marmoricola sp.]|nr:hypothetical protein [Marmoricola sp.]